MCTALPGIPLSLPLQQRLPLAENSFAYMRPSDARMAVICAGAADDPQVGGSANKKMHSDYLRVGRGVDKINH